MPQLVIYRLTYLPDFASLSNPSGSFIAVRIVMDAWPCRPLLRRRFDPLRCMHWGKIRELLAAAADLFSEIKEPVHQQTIVIAVPPCLRDGGKRGSQVRSAGTATTLRRSETLSVIRFTAD